MVPELLRRRGGTHDLCPSWDLSQVVINILVYLDDIGRYLTEEHIKIRESREGSPEIGLWTSFLLVEFLNRSSF